METWTHENTAPLANRRLLKSEVVKELLGYKGNPQFWVAVRAAGVPFIRINRRRILFDEAAVNAWLDSRTVGGRESNPAFNNN